MSEHAFLPPSGAAAWVACSMWPHMNARYPQDDTPQSMEGTAAHWVASELLEGRGVVLGQVTPTGYVVDDEMIEGATLYADTARIIEGDHNIEKRIRIPFVHEHNWGTPDDYVFDDSGFNLTIMDFKYGHDHVDVFENWQLINYSAGLTGALNGLDDQHTTVNFCIVQPRSYQTGGPVKWWTVKASDLRPYYNKLQTAAAKVFAPDPKATVGPQCKHCPGRHACNSLQSAAMQIADVSMAGVPIDMPPAALGLELRNLKRAASLLNARISGLESQAEAMLRRGDRVPFFALQQEYGRLRWTLPNDAIFAIGDSLGVDLRKPNEPITPTQAKKVIDDSVIKVYSERPLGSAQLTQVDDTTARKVFGHN